MLAFLLVFLIPILPACGVYFYLKLIGRLFFPEDYYLCALIYFLGVFIMLISVLFIIYGI